MLSAPDARVLNRSHASCTRKPEERGAHLALRPAVLMRSPHALIVQIMTEAAGAFDAWGSALIGGLASAVAVLLAVFVTFYLTNRKAKETERREAAARLMVEVSNLRDEACSHTTGPIGDYALYKLRNTLYTTYVPLHTFESFKVVDQFYVTVEAWRGWGRGHDDRPSEDPRAPGLSVCRNSSR
jgi:hypothetical protein